MRSLSASMAQAFSFAPTIRTRRARQMPVAIVDFAAVVRKRQCDGRPQALQAADCATTMQTTPMTMLSADSHWSPAFSHVALTRGFLPKTRTYSATPPLASALACLTQSSRSMRPLKFEIAVDPVALGLLPGRDLREGEDAERVQDALDLRADARDQLEIVDRRRLVDAGRAVLVARATVCRFGGGLLAAGADGSPSSISGAVKARSAGFSGLRTDCAAWPTVSTAGAALLALAAECRRGRRWLPSRPPVRPFGLGRRLQRRAGLRRIGLRLAGIGWRNRSGGGTAGPGGLLTLGAAERLAPPWLPCRASTSVSPFRSSARSGPVSAPIRCGRSAARPAPRRPCRLRNGR